MSLAHRVLYTVAGLVAAILQLLFEAAFGPGKAGKPRHRGGKICNDAHARSQLCRSNEQASLSGEALVRLCRGLQEEVRRKERDLTTCKADVAALRLERRRVAQERKQEAQQKELLWQRLNREADERSDTEREHGKMVAAMQKELTYAQHAKGAFQAQVHQLERDVGNLRSELAARGHKESEMWQERSELIDDKARLGRQIIELSKRAQQAEADLATSRATARALASNSAELQEQLAKESSAHAKLEQRADELAGELAATKAELDQEVEDLRDVLNATLKDKGALATQCSALEAQVSYMEADSMQLRAWLEEVIQGNDALESRVEALEASAAMARHEKAALEGWVRGSVEEQAAASTRLASFQALSRGLEKDGVCKSAVIGVLAIHLVQREHQLSQLLRRPVPGSIHALSSSNGETIESDGYQMSLATSAHTKQPAVEPRLESAAGHEPTTPSRFASAAPGMASTSTSGHSSPCNGSAEEPPDPSQPSSGITALAQAVSSGTVATLPQPSSAPSPSSSSSSNATGPARTILPDAGGVSSIRRAASSAAAQIPLPRELLLLSRARSALPPHADRSAHALWQERLEHHLRSRGAPRCPVRPAHARAQSGPLHGSPRMVGDVSEPSALPNLAQSPQKAFTKGPQVLATA